VTPWPARPVTFLSVIYKICVHQIEMSLFLPFRNVTVGWGRAAGVREARGVAQRPTDARGVDA
jgi:hypothetical protein